VDNKITDNSAYLCSIAGVSRSGYYAYLKSENIRKQRNKLDLESKKIIMKAFVKKGYSNGARGIKMNLENNFNINFNLKKIRRIMKKYRIECPHRKPIPYKRIAKATKEHTTLKNTLDRNFKQGIPFKVLLTDITYLTFGKGQRAYLSAIKDVSTNEILASNISTSINLDIALTTINKLTRRQFKLDKNCFIHSDQGVHYTSPIFQKLLKNKGIGQSMSRKGNCWDNAPIESFFGHMKDHVDLSKAKNIKDVEKIINHFVDYYNKDRYQWDLKKMTPVQYRNHLLS
jgi:transposase InsO family protein